MLILTRRTGETIWLGDDIRLIVVSVKGDWVRLGIEAPPGIRVDREEVRARIVGGGNALLARRRKPGGSG